MLRGGTAVESFTLQQMFRKAKEFDTVLMTD